MNVTCTMQFVILNWESPEYDIGSSRIGMGILIPMPLSMIFFVWFIWIPFGSFWFKKNKQRKNMPVSKTSEALDFDWSDNLLPVLNWISFPTEWLKESITSQKIHAAEK